MVTKNSIRELSQINCQSINRKLTVCVTALTAHLPEKESQEVRKHRSDRLDRTALLQKSIGRSAGVRWFGFVAERGLNLARPLKAGTVTASKSRRVSDD